LYANSKIVSWAAQMALRGGNIQHTSHVFETLIVLVSCVVDQWSPNLLDVGQYRDLISVLR